MQKQKSTIPIQSKLGYIDCALYIDIEFLKSTINDIIKLKNPLYDKNQFETEPVDLKIYVSSPGVNSIDILQRRIHIVIPVDIRVTKRIQTPVYNYELQEIRFGVNVIHSFSIDLNREWIVKLIPHEIKVEWREKPYAQIFYLKIDISTYVKPLVQKYATDMIKKEYPLLSKKVETHLIKSVQLACTRMSEPIFVN